MAKKGTKKGTKKARLTGGAEGVKQRMANGHSTLRLKGDLEAVRRRRTKSESTPRSRRVDRVPADRPRLCAQCGHSRSVLDFVEVRDNAVTARYSCCLSCRRRHPERDERIDRRSVRTIGGGLPTLGKGRR